MNKMEIVRVRLINSDEKGCEDAPAEVLKELKNITSRENGELIEFDKLKLEEIHVNLKNLTEADYLIYENSKEIFAKNFKSFFVGGDCSINYPILKAFNKLEKNPLLIVFDAYACCEENKKNESVFNNKNWLRNLIEKCFFGNKIILISARNFKKNEIKFLEENHINLIKMEVLREDLGGVCDVVMERARMASGFFVSLDINCVDPGFAPGTNNPESGGLSSGDLIYFLKRLRRLDNFKGADIVEINPYKDFNKMTVKLGAKLLAEMI